MKIFKGLRSFYLNKIFFLIVFFSGTINLFSQESEREDSLYMHENKEGVDIKKTKYIFELKKDPIRATLYSAIVPGLGQFYNEQYWKVPIALGIIIWPAYLCYENQVEYNKVRMEYRRRVNGQGREYLDFASDQQLLSHLKNLERNRDLTFLLSVLAYAFNIVDAHVSAHLIGFDVENVSLKPNLIFREETYIGMTIKFNL